MPLDNRVHHLVAANDCVSRANGQAKRAANTPRLINHGNAARAFQPIGRIERQAGLTGNCGQTLYAFLTTRRTLVDGRPISSNSLCVRCAVRIAAARALGLRKRLMDAQCHALRAEASGGAKRGGGTGGG